MKPRSHVYDADHPDDEDEELDDPDTNEDDDLYDPGDDEQRMPSPPQIPPGHTNTNSPPAAGSRQRAPRTAGTKGTCTMTTATQTSNAATEARKDIIRQFNQAVSKRMDRGMTKAQAVADIARHDPNLHEWFLCATNPNVSPSLIQGDHSLDRKQGSVKKATPAAKTTAAAVQAASEVLARVGYGQLPAASSRQPVQTGKQPIYLDANIPGVGIIPPGITRLRRR